MLPILYDTDENKPRPDYNHPEASEITKSLKKSPSGQGFVHFAIDGVYRSFNSRGEVLDYKQLSPEEIALMLASYKPLLDAETFAKLEAKMQGKDGRNVTDMEQILHPGPNVRPIKLNEKEKTEPTETASPAGAA